MRELSCGATRHLDRVREVRPEALELGEGAQTVASRAP